MLDGWVESPCLIPNTLFNAKQFLCDRLEGALQRKRCIPKIITQMGLRRVHRCLERQLRFGERIHKVKDRIERVEVNETAF